MKDRKEYYRQYAKERYANDPEFRDRAKRRTKLYQMRNKDKIRAINTNVKRSLSNEQKLLYGARSRASKNNIPFDLTIKDIVIPDVCPVLGIPLQRGQGRLTQSSPSLDRIIPELGYVVGNVAVISMQANRMKQNNTVETLVKLIEYMQRTSER